jgi:hypothetical protein
VIEGAGELGGKLQDRAAPAAVTGNDEVALLAVRPLPRRLARILGDDALVDVVVKLVDCHHAVAVEVGVASFEASNEVAGEKRYRSRSGGVGAVRARIRLPGELGGIARGQHDPADAVAFEGGRGHREGCALGAAFERTAVAAVEHQDLAA